MKAKTGLLLLALVAGGGIAIAATNKKDDKKTESPETDNAGKDDKQNAGLSEKVTEIYAFQKDVPSSMTREALDAALNKMTPQEIEDVHTFIFSYLDKNGNFKTSGLPKQDMAFENRMRDIVSNYKILERYMKKGGPSNPVPSGNQIQPNQGKTTTPVKTKTATKTNTVDKKKAGEYVKKNGGKIARKIREWAQKFKNRKKNKTSDPKKEKPVDPKKTKTKKSKGISGPDDFSDVFYQLISWADNSPNVADKEAFFDAILSMNATELENTHDYVFNYIVDGESISSNPELGLSMAAITQKYDILT